MTNETHTKPLTRDDLINALARIKANSMDIQHVATTFTTEYPEMRRNMTAELGWIESSLLMGHFLVIPQRIYELSIKELREKYGFYEEALARIYESRFLLAENGNYKDGLLIQENND